MCWRRWIGWVSSMNLESWMSGDYSFRVRNRDFTVTCAIERKSGPEELYSNITDKLGGVNLNCLEKELDADSRLLNQFTMVIEGVGSMQAVCALLAEEITEASTARRPKTYNLLGVSMGAHRARSYVWEIQMLMERAYGYTMHACLCADTSVEAIRTTVPLMWQRAGRNGAMQKLAGMIGATPQGILDVSACGDSENPRYYIAVATDVEDDTLRRTPFQRIPGPSSPAKECVPRRCRRAKADHHRMAANLWIYEYANGPDIEVYLKPDMRSATFEAWMPIVRKV